MSRLFGEKKGGGDVDDRYRSIMLMKLMYTHANW